MLDVLPNDIVLYIFRILHNNNVLALNAEYSGIYVLRDRPYIFGLENVLVGRYFNFRRLETEYYCKGLYIFNINTRELRYHYVKRYSYSLYIHISHI